MKDLVIFIPSIESGGVEKNLFYITKFIQQKFKNIYLVSADKPDRRISGKKIKLLIPKSNFFKNKNRLIKSFVCSYLIYKHFNNKNVLIFSLQSNFFSIFISKLIRSKIIIRLNTSPEKYVSNFFKKLFFKILYNATDEIIVNSNEFKKNLLKYFNLKSKVILNPIKIQTVKKKKISFFKNFKGLKIICIGRLTHQKDHITLLKALNLLKKNYNVNFKLYLIGKGYNFKLLENFIIENRLQKNIKLAGYKDKAFNYIKSSDLLILPSKHEGLPNTLLEAQAAGTPIISSSCKSGPREILLNGKLGELFKVGDYKSLSKKIYNHYNNQKILKQKSNLAKKYLYRFDYIKNLNKYVIIFNKYI
tara:strand:- start:682 stop:1764 length:1083 start_codon:yes stop_codon:yes gene_type:complete